MARPEKVQAVAEIRDRFESAEAVFLTEFAGLSVKEQQQLRRGLRAQGAEYKVYKMTLTRRAVDELGLEVVDPLLSGPTGLAFSPDPVATAKALTDFAGEHARLLIKGALMGTELLTPERVAQLSKIEPREVLLAKIAGAMKAPMAAVAGVTSALLRNSASLLLQLAEKKQAEAPAPAAPPAVAEAPAEEPAADTAPAEEAGDAAPEAAAQEAEDAAPEAAAAEAPSEAPDAEATAEAATAAPDEPAAAAGTEDEPADEAEEEK